MAFRFPLGDVSRLFRRSGHAGLVAMTAKTSNGNYYNWRVTPAAALAAAGFCVASQKQNSPVSCSGVIDVPTRPAVSDEDVQNAVKELRAVLGKAKIVTDADDRAAHAKDAWSHHRGTSPCVIALPECTEDVSKIAKICNKYKLPIIPYGCGTSLEGNTTDLHGSLLCDMRGMDKIVELRLNDADITVEAGIDWVSLNQKLSGTGFFFPMDPGPGAAIGGMIGTCCSGTNAVRYGVMKDWVLSATVVLANGDIVKLGSRARKDVAGYDLVRLFVGSEGTLGIVTETTLKLAPRPKHELVAICSFDKTSEACEAVGAVIREGIPVHGAEYLDALSIKIINKQSRYGLKECPTIMFRFAGTENQLKEAEAAARRISTKYNCSAFQYRSTAESVTEFEKLWQARKNLLFDVIGWGNGRESWITDVCVPIGRLPNVLEETERDLLNSKFDAPIFGHVGDGNFHAAILFNPDNPDDMRGVVEMSDRIARRAIKASGTCTGEHGIGLGKKKFLVEQVPLETINLMRSIKRTLDPNNIMNPGKIFDME